MLCCIGFHSDQSFPVDRPPSSPSWSRCFAAPRAPNTPRRGSLAASGCCRAQRGRNPDGSPGTSVGVTGVSTSVLGLMLVRMQAWWTRSSGSSYIQMNKRAVVKVVKLLEGVKLDIKVPTRLTCQTHLTHHIACQTLRKEQN